MGKVTDQFKYLVHNQNAGTSTRFVIQLTGYRESRYIEHFKKTHIIQTNNIKEAHVFNDKHDIAYLTVKQHLLASKIPYAIIGGH